MDGLTTKISVTDWPKLAIAASIRWIWNIRQYGRSLTRSFGVWGWSLVIVCIVGLASIGGAAYWGAQLHALERVYARATVPRDLLKVDLSSSLEAKQRLQDFEQILIPHEGIPQALGEVLQLAEDEGLLIRRGNYRPDEDSLGHFMRYRINMPIKGTTEAVNRFLRSALRAQRNLILESIQLKRDALESNELEANVQWVLLTHLPSAPIVPVKGEP